MTLLQNIIKENIPINWTTILVGWLGPENYTRLVNLSDIALYASKLIESKNSNSDDIYFLAGVDDTDAQKVNELIQKLGANKNTSIDWEKRKWRLVLLKEVVDNLNQDPLYGTLELLEFWSNWNFPSNNPVEDLKDKQNINLYTEENFKKLIAKHYDWLKTEKIELKSK